MPLEPSARGGGLRLFWLLPLIAGALVATGLGAVAAFAATSGGATRAGAAQATERAVTNRLAPLRRYRRLRSGDPAPWERQAVRSIVSVRDGGSVTMRSGPGGDALMQVGPRTEFGTRTSMAVVRRRGRWLGVSTAERPNGKLGWVDGRSDAVRRRRTRLAIHVDLSARRLELRRAGAVIERGTVSVGRLGSTTPTGRFAVTDKLRGDRFGSYYGCCILALSGTQPNLPPGWPGGNRLAIHGTPNPSSLGGGVSAGCVHASVDTLEVLMRQVPAGTPVFIRA
ncbi:MAG TPA: L,D-transpeptidase [Thermoleophilaceae bacterium]|nr:L,D-transpeptidase [Thermoleophilaceae bacterium]